MRLKRVGRRKNEMEESDRFEDCNEMLQIIMSFRRGVGGVVS